MRRRGNGCSAGSLSCLSFPVMGKGGAREECTWRCSEVDPKCTSATNWIKSQSTTTHCSWLVGWLAVVEVVDVCVCLVLTARVFFINRLTGAVHCDCCCWLLLVVKQYTSTTWFQCSEVWCLFPPFSLLPVAKAKAVSYMRGGHGARDLEEPG